MYISSNKDTSYVVIVQLKGNYTCTLFTGLKLCEIILHALCINNGAGTHTVPILTGLHKTPVGHLHPLNLMLVLTQLLFSTLKLL